MPENRATMVWPEDVVEVVSGIEVPRSVRIPRLDETAETAVCGVGVPQVEPIT